MSDSGVNDQPVANEPEDRLPKVSPGARLAALREERGWTVEQVASQLNLAPRQILAIERDDYPSLPGMAITRGFVRAYAKLLKIDAAPLLVDLGGETVLVHDSLAPQKTLSTPFADSRMPSMTEPPAISSKWVIGALLAVLLGVGIWATRQGGEQAAAPAAVKNDVANMAGAEAEKPSPEAKSEPAGTTPSAAEGDAAAVSPPAEAAAAPAPAASPVVAAPSAAQAQTPAAEMPAAAGKDTLQLKVREESWIEIRRSSDNKSVFSRLVKAGETESVQIAEPVSVVIGNAAGVDATLRGEPVELKPSSKSNVARLNLK
ncbi:MAG TPA: RodZ domain-containing protein [Noviherbaspirillum sp.]|nr:RodZ domain-containing protein [Noviherbaspirillum sp.]